MAVQQDPNQTNEINILTTPTCSSLDTSFNLPSEIYGLSSFQQAARSLVKNIIDFGSEVLPSPFARWLRIELGEHLPFPTFRNQMLVREILDQILQKDSNCIDIGAHNGYFTRLFLKLSPLGEHLAFEPLPAMASHLKNTFNSQKNVTVHQIALSSQTESAPYYSFDQAPQLSGLARRSISDRQILPKEITVECATLDSLTSNCESLRFIKIDVEGAELDVLRGGENTIKRTRPFIWCEHSSDGAPAFGVSARDFYHFVTQHISMNLFTAHDWLMKSNPLNVSSFESLVDSRQVSDFLLVPSEAI